MKTFTCMSTGQLITLTEEIANSGEGKVWRTNRNGYLAKTYHEPTPERIEKLKVMIASSPQDPNSHLNHISFAWPKSLLKAGNGTCVGFLMPEITGGKELLNIYNPQSRKKSKLEIDWRFLHTTALNIASIIQAIHAQGYVLGDIKPQNILVNNRALPSIIDTDSFQVYHPKTSQVYRCRVGSPGFTPPELIGKDFSTTNQTNVHDHFRLAVIIYHLLFGDSPSAGNWIGSGEQPSPDELIKRGLWVYGVNSLIQPVERTIPLNIVHPEIKRCFLKCFNDGYTNPKLRPSAAVWVMALKLAMDSLNICGKVDKHYFSRTYEKCYWCERANNLGTDIFQGITSSNSIVNKNINSYSTVSQAVIQPVNQSLPQSLPLTQASQTPSNSNSGEVFGAVMTAGFFCLFIIWIFFVWKFILIKLAFLLIIGLIGNLIQGLIYLVKKAKAQAKKSYLHIKKPVNSKYLVIISAAMAFFIGLLGLINLAGFGMTNVLSPKEVLQSKNFSVQITSPTQASSALTSPSVQIKEDEAANEPLQPGFPIVAQDQSVSLAVQSARYSGGALLMKVKFKNTGGNSVRFLYSFLDITDDQGRTLSASTEGLPAELPANGQTFSGTVSIPMALLGNVKKLSLTLTDYPEQKLKLKMHDIPVERSAPVTAEVSPKQAIIDYYSNVNNHLYITGWNTLTNRFKNLNPGIKGGYQEYLDWWKSVQRAQIQDLKLVSITSTEAVVDARIKYFMRKGNVTSSSLRFFLVKNVTKNSWMLNDISHT